jgi:cytochrome P450
MLQSPAIGVPALSGSRRQPLPSAPGIPLLHNAVDLLLRPLEFFVQSYHAVGPVFRASGPGRQYVVLAGPKANAFLLHGGERFLDNRPIYRHLAGELDSANYPIATTGERHSHLRRTIKQAFTHEAFAQYVPAMCTTAEALLTDWRPGACLGVLEMMHRLVGEQLGRALVSQPLGEMLPDAVTFARYSVGAGLGAYPTFMARFPNYRAAKRRMLHFMRRIVAAHRARPADAVQAPDFVDLLLEATDHTGAPFGDNDVIANAQMAYSNGLLYGAPACAFLLYGLLKHPHVLERVRAEVDELFAAGPPTLQSLMQAKALMGATLESMRLYPIALATPRLVTTLFPFAGHEVPAGNAVLFAVSVCHFLPEVFPEPYTFDIGRYSEPRSEHRQAGMFVPFGLGSHSCLGAGLVKLLVMTTVATLVRYLDLSLAPARYTLRRVVNPFPEPEAKFAVRVAARRV